MISPTIGRRVWFWATTDQSQPFDAGIAYVHSNTMINISYSDANGVMKSATSVPLWHGDGARPTTFFCEWMPYQKGQAAKVEALQAQLGGVAASPLSDARAKAPPPPEAA